MTNEPSTSPPGAGTAPAPRPGAAAPWLGMSLMRQMSQDFLGVSQKLQQAHGDIVFMRMYWEQVCAVFSPELMRTVLVDNARHLVRQERSVQVFSEVQGQSVMVSEGAAWQRQHRMLMPAFSPRRVAGYAALMVGSARRALDRVVSAAPGSEAVVDVEALTVEMTMEVILRTLFSSPPGEEAGEVARAVKSLNRRAMREMFWPMTLPDWLPLPGKAEKRHALRVLDGLVDRHLRKRASEDPASAPQDDLLAMMMAARDDAPGQAGAVSESFSRTELRDQCMVMFLAGHDTTATALQWWAWLMAEHPEAAGRAREEVDQVLGGRDPGPEDLPKMEWLLATLKETLRLYPPAPGLLTRRATQDIRVGEWVIPKRSLVMAVPWVAHHDARWFPEPQAFKPERFVAGAPPLPRGAWAPFGMGPRVCIGQHFAMQEMGLLAAMLLQRYVLSLVPGASRPATRLEVTLRPASRMLLNFRRTGRASPGTP